MTMTSETVWMTSASQQRLQNELADLERTISADTETQARMLQLRELLRRAEIGRKPDDGLVEPGMRVTVRFTGDGSTATFLLGHREVAQHDDGIDVQVYSPSSPLGVAITGRYVRESVSYAGPTSQHEITIVRAVPFD
jgi:transcription elongation factor GreA